jgi:hypothetical protein
VETLGAEGVERISRSLKSSRNGFDQGLGPALGGQTDITEKLDTGGTLQWPAGIPGRQSTGILYCMETVPANG